MGRMPIGVIEQGEKVDLWNLLESDHSMLDGIFLVDVILFTEVENVVRFGKLHRLEKLVGDML